MKSLKLAFLLVLISPTFALGADFYCLQPLWPSPTTTKEECNIIPGQGSHGHRLAASQLYHCAPCMAGTYNDGFEGVHDKYPTDGINWCKQCQTPILFNEDTWSTKTSYTFTDPSDQNTFTYYDPMELGDYQWMWDPCSIGETSDEACGKWYAKCPDGHYLYNDVTNMTYKCVKCDENKNEYYWPLMKPNNENYEYLSKYIFQSADYYCSGCPGNSHLIMDEGYNVYTGCKCNTHYHYTAAEASTITNANTMHPENPNGMTSYTCVPNTYTIKFIHNESTDDSKAGCLTYPNAEPYTPDKITYNGTDDPSITMPKYTDTKLDQWTGHHFIRWQKCNKDHSISNSSYTEGQHMTITGEDSTRDEISFVAIFAPNQYTITYNANGASKDIMPSDTPCTYGDECALEFPTSLTSNGKYFTGWKVNNEGPLYKGDAKVTDLTTENGATITLYAQWESCPKGYYCSGDSKYRCPGGSTTNGGASTITACYLAKPTEVYYNNLETNPAEISNIPLKAVKYQGTTSQQSL